MKADITTLDAKKAGTVELPDHVFGLEPRADILQRMVRYQLAKRRSGTAHVKDRSEINATTAKMYRQKGTGRARHSSKKAPLFRGGGAAFGPKPRSFAIDLPKKVRALALRHALSAKAKSDTLIVIDTLPMLLGPRVQRVLDPFVRVLSFAIVAFLFAASIPLVRSVWPTTLATVDWISNGWAYLAFTASFGLMILYSLAPLIPGFRRPRSSEARA